MPILRLTRKILSLLIPDKLVYVLYELVAHKRCQYQKILLKTFGNNFYLAPGTAILSPGSVSFGDDCAVNEFVHILGGGGVTIGNGVWIANHASLITESHPTNVEYIGHHSPILAPIIIEDNVWIGSHAVIVPGVRLGKSCIVGAGSVVTKDVPPYAIVAGVPAKVLRYKIRSYAVEE